MGHRYSMKRRFNWLKSVATISSLSEVEGFLNKGIVSTKLLAGNALAPYCPRFTVCFFVADKNVYRCFFLYLAVLKALMEVKRRLIDKKSMGQLAISTETEIEEKKKPIYDLAVDSTYL